MGKRWVFNGVDLATALLVRRFRFTGGLAAALAAFFLLGLGMVAPHCFGGAVEFPQRRLFVACTSAQYRLEHVLKITCR